LGEFEWGKFFTPSPLELRESGNKGKQARFVVLTVEPYSMSSPKRSLHGKVKETGARVGLMTHGSNELLISGARLIFQEKIVPEQGKDRGNS
jgi:hypothetical protein